MAAWGLSTRARQPRLGRLVALKMILHGGHASLSALARFRVEAQAIARLQHPNIVQVHEVGEEQGKPFFSLEFCPGGSLSKRLKSTPLPALEAAQLVQTLARAMQAAHDKQVIHRDLKPANVLLTEDGTPKISDFGLAKKLDDQGQTGSGAILGTPSYMSPEQASGKSKELGPACDIYALGAILYECLTGRPPFKGATPMETVLAVVSAEVVPPGRLNPKVPRDLETICLKCLQHAPAKRYASAGALAEDLQRFQVGEPILARPVGWLERTVKWIRKRPAAAALAGLLVLLAGAALGGGFWLQQYRFDLAQEEERVKTRQAQLQVRQTKGGKRHSRCPGGNRQPPPEDSTKACQTNCHRGAEQRPRWLERHGGSIQAAWQRADRLAAANSDILGAELSSRVQAAGEQLKADRANWKLAKELDDLRLENFRMKQHRADWSQKSSRYVEVFAPLGLDFQKGEPAQLAARIQQHPLRFVLVAALDYWASVTSDTKDLLPRLLQTSRLADPHPWRNRVRDLGNWFSKEQS